MFGTNPQLRCDTFALQADDLVGRDLSPERAAQLTEHARVCLRCARVWRSALERSAALQSLSIWDLEASGVKPPSPGETANAVFARLAAGEGLPTWRERWLRPAGQPVKVLAAAMLLLSAGFVAYSAWGDGRGTARPTAQTPDVNTASSDAPVFPGWNGAAASPVAQPVAFGAKTNPTATASADGETLQPMRRLPKFLRGDARLGVNPLNSGLLDGTAPNIVDGPSQDQDGLGVEYAGAFLSRKRSVRPH